jgi:integrase
MMSRLGPYALKARLQPIVRDLTLVCAGTGISPGQIRHLRWRHIAADHRTIDVPVKYGDGTQTRPIALPSCVQDALARLRTGRDDPDDTVLSVLRND